MARQKEVVTARPAAEGSQAALQHVQPALEDIDILVPNSKSKSRSCRPYEEAYHAVSPLLQLPILSNIPTYDPNKPLDLDKKTRQPRPVAAGKAAELLAPKHTALARFQGVNARAPPILPPEAASKYAHINGCCPCTFNAGNVHDARPAKYTGKKRELVGFFGQRTTGIEGTVGCRNLNDVVFYTGGPIWAMDWCPATPDADGNEASRQYVAVGVHGKGQEEHLMGKPTAGRGLVQIWEVQHEPCRGQGKAAPPRLAVGLCHNRGTVWAVQWCPQADKAAAGDVSSLRRIGLLAVLYGDGQLEVLAVPSPDSLENLGATDMDIDQEAGSSGQEPQVEAKTVYMRLKPQAYAAAISPTCLGSCLDWLPSSPHDLLLVGHWDGSAAIWRIPQEGSRGRGPEGRELQLICHLMADMFAPLRAICWAPPRVAEGTSDMSHRHIFVTAGHSGTVKIWDSRDPFLPALESQSNVSWILEALWLPHPDGILFCQDDGAFKFLELNSQHRPEHERNKEKVQTAWWGATRGGLWSCHVNPASGHAAYAGEGGTVAVAPPEFEHRLRHPRPPHTTVSRTRWENNLVICMGGQETRSPTFGLKPTASKGEVGDGMSAIHKVRWSKGQAKDSQATWLASGGESGIVRCQRISLYAIF